MTQDLKQKLWDGSFRVTQLARHDGEFFALPMPIEYAATCIRLATTEKSDQWQDAVDAWIITIGNQSTQYYTGTGLRKQGRPVKPELSSVLYSLVMDADACEMSFEEWCLNFGYDGDSMKAMDTYRNCQKNADKLAKAGILITDDLRDFMSEY